MPAEPRSANRIRPPELDRLVTFPSSLIAARAGFRRHPQFLGVQAGETRDQSSRSHLTERGVFLDDAE